ncbi:DeoR/GlpR transcriptional regulator [Oerskovia turbata]|uniref:DeoR/GlpR transcriptional regulator n=1 Tax=Oerskovia turbata TaxID=1713 RepID=A0A4Q1L0H4_9CELL|nr:DeoR/GlpR family DNA-binding transcription regulator [Oerskovia turbata]RXR27312.1 DeoR/GlpR transcriptional regulator [Oerskovia turbata]RXR36114.1 DeoR/GlpR transcriptional regulator [Oerskovia turbata]TGJ94953.1 DeoR/GlpR transcriptional regulator [Actinotalea fermentans ATCC 43279 = JCM 9966 = DSM 3133]
MARHEDPAVGDAPGGLSKSVRWERMLALLADRQRLSVTEVSEQFGISESTVRRDFDQMADRRLAHRTHGGVVAASVAYGLPGRYGQQVDDRQLVAEAAARLVAERHTGQPVVGFNGGRTTTLVAKALGEISDQASEQAARHGEHVYTVVTSALNIATDLVLRPQVRMVCLGGTARAQSYELTGPLAVTMARSLWLDVLVVGMVGIDVHAGLTCADPDEAGVTTALVEHSRAVVAVGTSDKLGVRSFAQICDLSAVTTLVTDAGATEAQLAPLRDAGIEVVVVPTAPPSPPTVPSTTSAP